MQKKKEYAYELQLLFCLDKTLKGIRGVRLDNRKGFFVHQVLGTNILSAFFLSFNKLYYIFIKTSKV